MDLFTASKKGGVVKDKKVIEHGKYTEYIVTFDDGHVVKPRKSKVFFYAASYERFVRFLYDCKKGDVWEPDDSDKEKDETDDNTSGKTDK